MTIAEILEQAQTLSVEDRKKLVKLLVDTLDDSASGRNEIEHIADAEHWGQRLVRLLQQTEPADWGDPSIEDPVEALQALRRQEEARLDPYWSGEK